MKQSSTTDATPPQPVLDANLTAAIETRIMAFMADTPRGVSFAELTRDPPVLEPGPYGYELLDNLVVWDGLAAESIQALRNLFKADKIHATVSTTLVYVVDGTFLNMPVANSLRAYKTPRWLPMVVNLGPYPNKKTLKAATLATRRKRAGA